MFDRLPPLQTLRAFEASGRLLSMTKAADELHLTHGAISRHIKHLEEHLGAPLFRRMTRRIVLTHEGAEFLAAITRILGELTREAERLRLHDVGTRFTITTSVSFASKWLAPRLHRLKTLHPEFDIHLDVTDTKVDLNGGQVDAGIRYGSGRYRQLDAERIMDESVMPVCSPEYRNHIGALTKPADLRRCTLLHEDRMLANWEQWFAVAGIKASSGRTGPAYSHGSMAIEAAIRGEGIALGRSALVAEDIAEGRLIALFPDLSLKAERGYDLVYRIGEDRHPKVSALRTWLKQETAPGG
jgi:LysR family transcriptional regulator, glycine cleavage system transcriptional activator